MNFREYFNEEINLSRDLFFLFVISDANNEARLFEAFEPRGGFCGAPLEPKSGFLYARRKETDYEVFGAGSISGVQGSSVLLAKPFVFPSSVIFSYEELGNKPCCQDYGNGVFRIDRNHFNRDVALKFRELGVSLDALEVSENGAQEDYSSEDAIGGGARRNGHSQLAQAVKANYGFQCAMSEINVPEFLVCSHIVPWSVDRSQRLNPANAICLSTFFDRAFDQGYLTFGENFECVLSSVLKSNEALFRYFEPYEGKKLRLPRVSPPRQDFLAWHRSNKFRS